MARQHKTIKLLGAENLLVQLLLECRDDIISDQVPKLDIRFAGGWVRDKLLGIHSIDIDVALSTMAGMQFGEALRAYYFQNGTRFKAEAQRLGVAPVFNGPFKISRNLEKSKNLETAVANIFGLDVDFVNLRRKAEHGSSPEIKFGTPEEDAAFRDSTINALYFNLDGEKIEDFTGMGLHDMAAGILRTPIEPHDTFMDDPLRVLRVIRFASKLEYAIDDATRQSMKDERIHTAFNVKLNRQRVGAELEKIMNGSNPPMAFQLIQEMGLYSSVFLGSAWEARRTLTELLLRQQGAPWPPSWPRAYQCLAVLLEDGTILGKELAQSEPNREYLWILAAYAPIAGLRSNPAETVKCVVEAIKATTHVSKVLEKSLRNMDDIISTVELVAQESHKGNLARSTVGVAIRPWGANWRLQVLYSLLAEVTYDSSSMRKRLERYLRFMEFVAEQGLQDAALEKQILTAAEVKAFFELQKSGDFMKGTIDSILRWQFDNKDSSKEEALEWLSGQKEHFGIP